MRGLLFLALATVSTTAHAQSVEKYLDLPVQVADTTISIPGENAAPWKAYYNHSHQLLALAQAPAKATGTYVQAYYPLTGTLKEKGIVEHGKRTGEWHSYYTTGQLKSIDNYDKGKPHGPTRSYDSLTRGQIYQGQYEHGEHHGMWKSYYDSAGKYLMASVDFGKGGNRSAYKIYDSSASRILVEGLLVDGERDGLWKEYYRRTGKIKLTATYLAGKMHGKMLLYDSLTSAIIGESEHEKGIGIGIARFYHPDGKLKKTYDHARDLHAYYDSLSGRKNSEGRWLKDKAHGIWKYFFADGSLHLERTYDHGNITTKAFYDSVTHIKTMEGPFGNGGKQGMWKYFSADGRVVEYMQEFKNDTLDGEIMVFHPATSMILRKGRYANGSRHGLWTFYYQGTILRQVELEYRNGMKWGRLVKYDSLTQQITEQGMYERDKETGTWQYYYPGTKQLSRQHKYDALGSGSITFYDSATQSVIGRGPFSNNSLSGQWIYYYAGTEKLMSRAHYEKGMLNGKASFYDSASAGVAHEGMYKDGERIGTWKYYYPATKKLKSSENYLNGVLHGDFVLYDSNGVKTAQGIFKNGLRDMGWTYYFTKTKTIHVDNKYSNGLLNGLSTEYDTTGAMISAVNYKNGKLNGKYRLYHTGTTNVWCDADYRNDTLDGVLQTFYSDKKIKRYDVYNNGKLVSGKCYDQVGNETTYSPFRVEASYMIDVMNYIRSSLQYPPEALANNVEGEVWVGFMIGEDGKVMNPEILKSLGNGCDEEAIRIISNMRRWTPLQLDGVAIKSYMQLPVTFVKPTNNTDHFHEGKERETEQDKIPQE